MRFLIITADKSTLLWPSLDKKLAAIKIALNSGKNADWLVDIKFKSATPTINKEEEKIDTKWLQEHIKEFFGEYDMVAFHFSEKQSNAWGIRPTLRGSNPQTDDEFGDFYFSSDENSKRLGFDRFVQVALHEASHEYLVDTKQTDITHEYHSKHKDITGLYKTFDWSKFQARRQGLKKQKNALESIVERLRAILAKKPSTGTKPQVKPNFEPPNDLLPLVKRKADAFVKDAELFGLPIRITEGFRSFERQNELYAQGRTKPGKIVTQAKGGQSNHNYGCAIDIVFRKLGYDASNDQWLALASIAERHGFEWGGDWDIKEFVDKPHFEMTLGYKFSDFQKGLVDYNKFK